MTRLIISSACCAVLLPALTMSAAAGDLKQSIAEAAKSAKSVSTERRKLIDPIAKSIAAQLKKDGKAAIVFVCTHNSRRSQFSQVWAHAAAVHYGLKHVRMASGGTEATAANLRTILALRRAGFTIDVAAPGTNPIYAVREPGRTERFRVYSKVYSDKKNPQRRFIVVLCCSDADEKCPVVQGAVARFPLHYVDPKKSDGTPRESATYDERSKQIAAEMFYLISRAKELSGEK